MAGLEALPFNSPLTLHASARLQGTARFKQPLTPVQVSLGHEPAELVLPYMPRWLLATWRSQPATLPAPLLLSRHFASSDLK